MRRLLAAATAGQVWIERSGIGSSERRFGWKVDSDRARDRWIVWLGEFFYFIGIELPLGLLTLFAYWRWLIPGSGGSDLYAHVSAPGTVFLADGLRDAARALAQMPDVQRVLVLAVVLVIAVAIADVLSSVARRFARRLLDRRANLRAALDTSGYRWHRAIERHGDEARMTFFFEHHFPANYLNTAAIFVGFLLVLEVCRFGAAVFA